MFSLFFIALVLHLHGQFFTISHEAVDLAGSVGVAFHGEEFVGLGGVGATGDDRLFLVERLKPPTHSCRVFVVLLHPLPQHINLLLYLLQPVSSSLPRLEPLHESREFGLQREGLLTVSLDFVFEFDEAL